MNTMGNKLRCLVVDDHPAIRFALSDTLQRMGAEVVAETGCGQEALKLIHQHTLDIVLLDLDIPGMDGLTLLEQIRPYKYSCKVVVLSGSDSQYLAARVRAAGGCGYIHKSESLELLPMVIKLVQSGYPYFTEAAISLCDGNACDLDTLSSLSVREFSVFQALAKGDSNCKISADLNLSPKTISTYKKRIFEKLQISNIAELIEIARAKVNKINDDA
ncbi:response regulator transcription factor [Aeromonas salmonicida]|uniref:response regulator transcription factor n=1 Tax=Aeromonas salmonicida TaxID=645 RepID=UPI00259FC2CC|nr:response regulator transcription factor [Aeromonas salmonicida]MDM5069912.1 response regulator transcription factor [Aeromonas salmonicida]